MTIFDPKTRTDPRARSHSEGIYAFLDRVNTSYFEQVRETINRWVQDADESERPALVRNLCSNNDRTWAAAYFELYLESLFLRLGYSIERHPTLPESLRSPDFLLTRADGFGCYVEATVASDSNADTAAHKRRGRIYETINTSVTSADFYLDIDFLPSWPPTPNPSNRTVEIRP